MRRETLIAQYIAEAKQAPVKGPVAYMSLWASSVVVTRLVPSGRNYIVCRAGTPYDGSAKST